MIRRVLGAVMLLSLFVVASAQAAAPPKSHDVFLMAQEGHFGYPPLTLGHKVGTSPNGDVLSKAKVKAEPRWSSDSEAATVSTSPSCTGVGFWVSNASGNYVSTELGYAGYEHAMLRARSATVGSWEQWQICYGLNGLPSYEIWSPAAQRWVSADISLGGELYGTLRAEGTGIAQWERFNITNGYHEFQANVNGLWVSTEMLQTAGRWAMLRARSSSVGPWEKYAFCC